MGLFARLKQWLAAKWSAVDATLITPGYSHENGTLASNETIFAAISILANDIASLPLSLRQNARQVYADEHPVAALLEQPNPNMTAFEFIRCMEVNRNVTGAAYAVTGLDAMGQVDSLWPMKTEHVTPMIDRETRELYYRVWDHLTGESSYLHNSLVISVSHISTDGVSPINPIDVLKGSLDYDREVKEFSINQMQNGLRAKAVITFTKPMSREQLEAFDEQIRTFRRSGILYLDPAKRLQELKESSIIDPKVFEVENITIARIARVYNIPLDRFLPERSSYSSAEQSDLNYLRDTLQPSARMYHQAFDQKLLPVPDRRAGYSCRFYLGGFARADTKTRGEYYQKAVRSAWMCPDEIRELEELPPIPGGLGREFLISKDMVPIRQLYERSGTD